MSEEEYIERLRQLLENENKNNKISYSKIYKYVENISDILKSYTAEVLMLSIDFSHNKKKIKNAFDTEFHKYFLNTTQKKYPFDPKTSVLTYFINKTNKDTEFKDLFSIYFGYAGWNGFKKNITLQEVFEIKKEYEKKYFSDVISFINGKGKTIEIKKTELKPSIDTLKVLNEIDLAKKSVVDNKKSDDKSNDKPSKIKEITKEKEVSDEKINPPTDNKKNTQENKQTTPKPEEISPPELDDRNEEDSKENQKDKKRKKRNWIKIVFPITILLGIGGSYLYDFYTNSDTSKKPEIINQNSVPDSTKTKEKDTVKVLPNNQDIAIKQDSIKKKRLLDSIGKLEKKKSNLSSNKNITIPETKKTLKPEKDVEFIEYKNTKGQQGMAEKLFREYMKKGYKLESPNYNELIIVKQDGGEIWFKYDVNTGLFSNKDKGLDLHYSKLEEFIIVNAKETIKILDSKKPERKHGLAEKLFIDYMKKGYELRSPDYNELIIVKQDGGEVWLKYDVNTGMFTDKTGRIELNYKGVERYIISVGAGTKENNSSNKGKTIPKVKDFVKVEYKNTKGQHAMDNKLFIEYAKVGCQLEWSTDKISITTVDDKLIPYTYDVKTGLFTNEENKNTVVYRELEELIIENADRVNDLAIPIVKSYKKFDLVNKLFKEYSKQGYQLKKSGTRQITVYNRNGEHQIFEYDPSTWLFTSKTKGIPMSYKRVEKYIMLLAKQEKNIKVLPLANKIFLEKGSKYVINYSSGTIILTHKDGTKVKYNCNAYVDAPKNIFVNAETGEQKTYNEIIKEIEMKVKKR